MASIMERQATLLEINLQLAMQRDTSQLLQQLCQKSRELFDARFALVAAHQVPGETRQVFTSGVEKSTLGDIETLPLHFESLLVDQRSCRLHNFHGHPQSLGFPASFPAFRSLLIVPIVSPGQSHGWLCLGDRRDQGEFDADDEQLAGLLAAQVGRIYENATLNSDLQLREGEFRTLADHMPGIIARFDQQLRHLFVSAHIEAVTGTPPEAFIGKTNRELGMPVELVDLWDRTLNGVFATGRPASIEFSFPNAGSSHHFEAHIVPEFDNAGNITTALSIVRDVSQIRDRERQLQAMFDASLDAMVIADDQGRYVDLNQAACEMFGLPREQLLGCTPNQVSMPGQDVATLWQRFLEEGKQEGIIQIRQPNGEIRDVEYRATARIRPHRHLSVLRDVTSRRKAEEAARRLEEQMQQVQKLEAIGRLAGGVAHDFNNLLTVITGYGDVLLSQVPLDHPHHKLLLEIRKAGERAARLTRQMLAFSRKQILQPVVLDLNSVVTEMEKMLLRLIGADVRVSTSLQSGLDPIKADPGQIEQIIMNLAVNARDAMPDGGSLHIQTRNCTLDESVLQANPDVQPGHYVLLAVSDSGCGMTEEVRKRIFEPFFTTKPVGVGTGLGLAMVYGIIKQSGGHVEVESKVGTGTTFKIFLPSVPNSPHKRPDSVEIRMPRGSETILLVEDEDGVRSLARLVLEMNGYTVLVARHGDEALSLFDQNAAVDLLITDLVMPGMSGRQLAEALAHRRPALRVLFVSGYTDEAIARNRVQESGAAFLQKPFTPSLLALKVREVLDSPAGISS